MRAPLLLGCLAAAAALWWAWSEGWVENVVERDPAGSVHIGVVYRASTPDNLFLKGVTLAVDEVNAAGGLLGHPVTTRVRGEKSPSPDVTPDEAVESAQHIATHLSADPRLVAVVGHVSSLTAIPASATYERNNKLYIAPYATNQALTAHRFSRVFALMSNDLQNASLLAQYAAEMGLKRVVMLSDNTRYGDEASQIFAEFAEARGLSVVYRDLLNIAAKSVEQTLLPLLDNQSFSMADIDGVVLIAQPEESGRTIRSLRRLGITAPILGLDAIDTPECEKTAGEAMKDVYALTVFPPGGLEGAGRDFTARYRARFQVDPSPWAALGYDAVHLLARAVNESQSLDPARIADSLRLIRYTSTFDGATGRFAFNRRGEAVGKSVYVVRHDGRHFNMVRSYVAAQADLSDANVEAERRKEGQ